LGAQPGGHWDMRPSRTIRQTNITKQTIAFAADELYSTIMYSMGR